MSKDSSHTYLHFTKPHHADLFEDFLTNPSPKSTALLSHIYVPPEHQPPNPEDEDDIVPDQHAAFGIARATQARREVMWRDLGLEGLVQGGNGVGIGSGVTGGGGNRRREMGGGGVLPR